MTYLVFTRARLDGIAGKDDLLRLDPALACVEETGFIHTTCWCCDLKIVVRLVGTALTEEDRAYLEEEETQQ